ncbi:hypothetical protein CMI47_10390 [Candidatus Pacearchaeota archaeon]|nr:hypothetical protein [Candidatus Pacearchaeota archaeon]
MVPEEYVDDNDFIKQAGITDLYYYVFLSTAASAESALINKESNILQSMYLTAGDLEYEEDNWLAEMLEAVDDAAGQFKQLELGTLAGDFTESDEELYTPDGIRIRKFQATTTFREASLLVESGNSWETTFDGGALFAFSSPLEYQELKGDLSEFNEYLENPPLINNSLSNISYEIIFENGAMKDSSEMIWVDRDKAPYDGYILQALTSNYHKAENITHEGIINSIQAILDDYEDEAQTDSNLQSVINDISYVLSVYELEPELLPRLNLLRKTFPSKSSVTTIGKLYVRFRKKIFEANKAILAEDRVFKQLVVNPKIIDRRDPTGRDWELKAIDTHDDENLLYERWYVSSAVAYSEDTDDDDDPDKIVTKGFFFFDYYKLKDRCNAMLIFDRSLLEQYFGDSILHSTLKVTTAEIKRQKWGRSGTEWDTSTSLPDYAVNDTYISMLATIDDNPKTTQVLYTYETDEEQEMGNYSFEDKTSGEEIYAYLMLRSFDLTHKSYLGSYQLMCFQFRDIYGSDFVSEGNYEDPYWEMVYVATVEGEDNTMDLIKEIISSYFDKMNTFEEYYDAANEACSYNDADGKFNSFFIEAMNQEYSGDFSAAPWIWMPIVYNIHKDLLNNKFAGEEEDLIKSSKAISAKISPYTGTLAQLEIFWNQVQTLYNENYDGWNYDIADSDTEPTLAIPKLLWTYESEANSFSYSAGVEDLPPIYGFPNPDDPNECYHIRGPEDDPVPNVQSDDCSTGYYCWYNDEVGYNKCEVIEEAEAPEEEDCIVYANFPFRASGDSWEHYGIQVENDPKTKTQLMQFIGSEMQTLAHAYVDTFSMSSDDAHSYVRNFLALIFTYGPSGWGSTMNVANAFYNWLVHVLDTGVFEGDIEDFSVPLMNLAKYIYPNDSNSYTHVSDSPDDDYYYTNDDGCTTGPAFDIKSAIESGTYIANYGNIVFESPGDEEEDKDILYWLDKLSLL